MDRWVSYVAFFHGTVFATARRGTWDPVVCLSTFSPFPLTERETHTESPVGVPRLARFGDGDGDVPLRLRAKSQSLKRKVFISFTPALVQMALTRRGM